MPRASRKKNYNSVYHVMCRSISEVDLYKNDDDKFKYLEILDEYKKTLGFKVYCYCIMKNHCHFIIDVNGTDVSTIFHGVNYKYAMYFNKRYERHGHLFQDRFKSKIIYNDRYLLSVTSYIHANPLALKAYENRAEDYKFSSLGIYLGIREDESELVDAEFIKRFFPSKDIYSKQLYLELIKKCADENIKEEVEFENEGTFHLNEREVLLRDYSVKRITKFLADRLNISEINLRMKNSKDTLKQRALYAILMKCLCNYKNRDISRIMGNMSTSNVSVLCSLGRKLVSSGGEYYGLIDEFLEGTVTENS